MEIFIISYYIPYPLNTGGRVSQFAFIDYLRNIHNITLAFIAYTTEDLANIEKLQQIFPNVNVKALRPFKLKEPSPKRQPANEDAYEDDSEELPKEENLNPWKLPEHEDPYFTILGEPKYREIIESLAPLFKERQYDLIQVEFPEIIDLVYALPKNVKTVFVHHEIRYARLKTYITANRKMGAYETYILNHIKSNEANLLNQYSAVITLSEDDKMVLEEFNLQVPVFASPFPIMENHFIDIPDKVKFDKLVFVGEDMHFPNKDAVQWYFREIEKEINRTNDLVLHVVGSWKNDSKRPLKSRHIVFAGFVDDIIDYCKGSVMIVPIRIGSGLRTKILYAMAQGVPVITTSMACEGIPVVNKEHVMIADTPKEMAAAVNYLRENPSELRRLALNAQELMRRKFSQQAAGDLRDNFYRAIVNKIPIEEQSTTP